MRFIAVILLIVAILGGNSVPAKSDVNISGGGGTVYDASAHSLALAQLASQNAWRAAEMNQRTTQGLSDSLQQTIQLWQARKFAAEQQRQQQEFLAAQQASEFAHQKELQEQYSRNQLRPQPVSQDFTSQRNEQREKGFVPAPKTSPSQQTLTQNASGMSSGQRQLLELEATKEAQRHEELRRKHEAKNVSDVAVKVTAVALVNLNYFDPKSNDEDKRDVHRALRRFQADNKLSEANGIGPKTLAKLSESILKEHGESADQLELAQTLVESARRMTGPSPIPASRSPDVVQNDPRSRSELSGTASTQVPVRAIRNSKPSSRSGLFSNNSTISDVVAPQKRSWNPFHGFVVNKSPSTGNKLARSGEGSITERR